MLLHIMPDLLRKELYRQRWASFSTRLTLLTWAFLHVQCSLELIQKRITMSRKVCSSLYGSACYVLWVVKLVIFSRYTMIMLIVTLMRMTLTHRAGWIFLLLIPKQTECRHCYVDKGNTVEDKSSFKFVNRLCPISIPRTNKANKENFSCRHLWSILPQ